tara:strand:- start:1256 stop:1753 length:498 start_codon:yes stop_codon:yes gene_type:complete
MKISVHKVKWNKSKREVRKTLLDFLDWSRTLHNYDNCLDPSTDEKMKNSKLKTNKTVCGLIHDYQFHNQDVSNLYQHTMRMLWGDCKEKRSKKSLKRLDDIIDVATHHLSEMTDTDIPNWHNDKSLLESLIHVKEVIINRSNNWMSISDIQKLPMRRISNETIRD